MIKYFLPGQTFKLFTFFLLQKIRKEKRIKCYKKKNELIPQLHEQGPTLHQRAAGTRSTQRIPLDIDRRVIIFPSAMYFDNAGHGPLSSPMDFLFRFTTHKHGERRPKHTPPERLQRERRDAGSASARNAIKHINRYDLVVTRC